MPPEPTGAPVRVLASTSSRSLSTARSVLRVLDLLGRRPAGVRADEVAAELGKSISTAYYLLTSLCEEGFAVHGAHGLYRIARRDPSAGATAAAEPAVPAGLAGAVDELFARTRRRSYLGVAHDGRIEITAVCGRQGVPRLPGLGAEIRESAHALAMGKVVLARLDDRSLAHYAARGLAAYTAHTITSPERLTAELLQVRGDGYAVDREEFDENFCCVAAPIHDREGRFVATLGLSVTAPVFDAERDALAQDVRAVAGAAGAACAARPRRRGRRRGRELQEDAETAEILSQSARGSTVDREIVRRAP